jgi:hypothetical protein
LRVTKKGITVKFHSLRTALVGSAIALSAAFLLGSCGGGGAASTGQGGNLILLPTSGGTFYAGMPATFTIAGGHKPYRFASTDPGVFPVPESTNENTLVVIPNNPGVIDSSVTPGQLPIKTVSLQMTDSTNGFQTSTFTVAQNFLTGYGVSFTSNCPPPAAAAGSTTAAAAPPACSGGETVVKVQPTFDGNLIGAKTLRIDTIRGPIKWYNQDGTLSGTDGHTITVTTDHEGKTLVLFKVDTGIATQVAEFRLTDVATGVSTEELVTITGTTVAGTLTLIPDTFSFTGPDSAHCGTGAALFLAFDGVPPYHAISTAGEIVVTPEFSNDNPGVFELNASTPNVCLTGAIVVVTDARLARGTLKVDTKVGSGAPVLPLRAIPSAIVLACGQNANVIISGGTAAPIVSSITVTPAGALTATAAGQQITITDVEGPTPTPTPVRTGNVAVTDGTSVVNIKVTLPNTCT